jgi:choline dehydrogenase-like flavoprotein
VKPKYDVVIVGAGVCGAILAKELGNAGKRVLVLEAGRATSTTAEGYASYVQNYFTALAKVPNSPYPANPAAPAPDVLTLNAIRDGVPDNSGYFSQHGPLPFGSDYVRARGGTTLHWLGTCLRMLPNDFRLRSRYGQGVDWPIDYDDLAPYYEKAEWEIGVSAETEDQTVHGIQFRPGYHFPMHRIPPSYVDQQVGRRLRGLKVKLGNVDCEVGLTCTPQGRNSTPHPDYKPVGSLGGDHQGERCEGNASCVPICPVQAKYSALKTLSLAPKEKVDVVCQAVATRVNIDPANGRVTGIEYQSYGPDGAPVKKVTVVGKVYVLAAHAIETAKLLLASGAANSSDQVGRNLMDHPTLLTWALMPEPIGSFRGPGSTSNIPTFRDGDFRKTHSAFIVPIDNWGWSWSAFSPYTDLEDFLGRGAFGRDLRRQIGRHVSRQLTLQFEFEQLPDPANRVTIDPALRDALGTCRPVIRYDLSDYTRAAMAVARNVSKRIFAKLGIRPDDDHTKYWPKDAGYLTYEGTGYSFRGAGHLVGTHRMGNSRATSVVNPKQQTWDHENLYLVGSGNMPTLGTANPTLTIAALAFQAAEAILDDLS